MKNNLLSPKPYVEVEIAGKRCTASTSISTIPANIYLLKVKNRNTRKRREICSKLTIKTPQRRS